MAYEAIQIDRSNPKEVELLGRIDECEKRVVQEIERSMAALEKQPPDRPEAAGRVALSRQAKREADDLKKQLAREHDRFAALTADVPSK